MYPKFDLSYSYSAFEPWIKAKTLQVQYEDIYLMHLKKLNALLHPMMGKIQYSKEALLYHLEEFPLGERNDILYHLGGALNHERYFSLLTPNPQKKEGPLYEKIVQTYGSFENFKRKWIEMANRLVGSGYIHLVIQPEGTLSILLTSNEELPEYYGMKSVITFDLWEHAYFLTDYMNREKYSNLFFDFFDYQKANQRYEKAKNIIL